MAEWIKVEKQTPEKPEMRQIAKLCNCTRGEAFLAFFRFYTWADSQTIDGIIEHISKEDADDTAKLAGFGAAAEAVGWMSFTDDGVVIHRWDRHNGTSSKRRATSAWRQERYRNAKPEPSAT